MILALDVHYRENEARIVCAEFKSWKDETAGVYNVAKISHFEEYVPGQFYRRELPCLLHVLEAYDMAQVDCIIIDGFVILDDDGRKGLGAHLFEALHGKVPIIGVAKTGFHENEGKSVRKIFRGQSAKSLYITSAGVDTDTAAELIEEMAGEYRIPNILREVDMRTKLHDT